MFKSWFCIFPKFILLKKLRRKDKTCSRYWKLEENHPVTENTFLNIFFQICWLRYTVSAASSEILVHRVCPDHSGLRQQGDLYQSAVCMYYSIRELMLLTRYRGRCTLYMLTCCLLPYIGYQPYKCWASICKTFMEPRNRFRGINAASLVGLFDK